MRWCGVRVVGVWRRRVVVWEVGLGWRVRRERAEVDDEDEPR